MSLPLSLGWDHAFHGQERCLYLGPGFQLFIYHHIWGWFCPGPFHSAVSGPMWLRELWCLIPESKKLELQQFCHPFSHLGLWAFICTPSFWGSGHLLQTLLLTYDFDLSGLDLSLKLAYTTRSCCLVLPGTSCFPHSGEARRQGDRFEAKPQQSLRKGCWLFISSAVSIVAISVDVSHLFSEASVNQEVCWFPLTLPSAEQHTTKFTKVQ